MTKLNGGSEVQIETRDAKRAGAEDPSLSKDSRGTTRDFDEPFVGNRIQSPVMVGAVISAVVLIIVVVSL